MSGYLTETMTFEQLFGVSEPKRVARSLTVTGPPLKVDAYRNSMYYGFNFKAHPSTTGLRHKGYIKFHRPQSRMPLSRVPCEVDCDCFSGDTLVLMSTGTYKPIKDIVPGDEVYTHKGRVVPVTKNNKRSLKPGEKVFKIEVGGFPLPIIVTGDHEFYTLRGNQTCRCGCGETFFNVRHDNFHPKRQLDRKFLRGHHPSHNRIPNGLINEILMEKELGCTPQESAKKHKISKGTVHNILNGRLKPIEVLPDEPDFSWVKVQDFREREWFLTPWLEEGGTNCLDPDLARLLGYYAAEGHLLGDKKQTCVTSVTFHSDEKTTLQQDIVEICKKLKGKGIRSRSKSHGKFRENLDSPYIFDNKTKSFDATIYVDKDFGKIFETHVGRGSHTKKLSKWFMSCSNETLRQFIIGLFLGDGHINKLSHFRYTSSSHDLVWQTSTILNRLKVRHNITKIGNKGTVSGEEGYAIDINNGVDFSTVYEWLYPYLRPHHRQRTPKEENRPDFHRKEGCLKYLRCKEEVTFDGPVYDLTLDPGEGNDDITYVVHSVAVMDCADYKFRFAWTNKQRGSSHVGPNSLNQALNRAPRITNPTGRPGLCKHILALRDYLAGQMYDHVGGEDEDARIMLEPMVKNARNLWINYPAAMAKAREREARYRAARVARNQGIEPSYPERDEPIEAGKGELEEVPPSTDVPPKGRDIKSKDKGSTPMVPPELPQILPGEERPQELGRKDKEKTPLPQKQNIDKKTRESTVDRIGTMKKSFEQEITLIQELEDINSSPDLGVDLPHDEQGVDGMPGEEAQDEPSEALQLLRDIAANLQVLATSVEGEDAEETALETDADLDDTEDGDIPELTDPEDEEPAGDGMDDESAESSADDEDEDEEDDRKPNFRVARK